MAEFRTHCYCGAKLPDPPPPHTKDWGYWKCFSCGTAFCQDCGADLDDNDQCVFYMGVVGHEDD